MTDAGSSSAAISAEGNLALALAPSLALAPELFWRWAFPGEERQLGLLRRWIALLLPECESRDDITSVVTELASNSVRHTASGARGGQFAVGLAWCRRFVHVAVADCGTPHGPRLVDDQAAEHGRGLRIVAELSVRTGAHGDHTGRVTWADVAWSGPPPAELAEVAQATGTPAGSLRPAARRGLRTLHWWTAARDHFAAMPPGQIVAVPGGRFASETPWRL